MSELETIAARKKETAKAAGKKQRVGKIVGGVAAAAAAGGLLKYIRPRPPARESAGVDPGKATRLKWMRLVSQSLTPETAAALLASTVSTIEKRVRNRSLYGFVVDQVWRLPKFQFHHGHVLPGLDRVVPKLDRKLHPIQVVNWFTLPNPDLSIDAEAVSPIKWLQSGRDAELVAELAKDVGSGL